MRRLQWHEQPDGSLLASSHDRVWKISRVRRGNFELHTAPQREDIKMRRVGQARSIAETRMLAEAIRNGPRIDAASALRPFKLDQGAGSRLPCWILPQISLVMNDAEIGMDIAGRLHGFKPAFRIFRQALSESVSVENERHAAISAHHAMALAGHRKANNSLQRPLKHWP